MRKAEEMAKAVKVDGHVVVEWKAASTAGKTHVWVGGQMVFELLPTDISGLFYGDCSHLVFD